MAFMTQIADLCWKVRQQTVDIEYALYDNESDLEAIKDKLAEQSRLLADNAAMLAEWCKSLPS